MEFKKQKPRKKHQGTHLECKAEMQKIRKHEGKDKLQETSVTVQYLKYRNS